MEKIKHHSILINGNQRFNTSIICILFSSWNFMHSFSCLCDPFARQLLSQKKAFLHLMQSKEPAVSPCKRFLQLLHWRSSWAEKEFVTRMLGCAFNWPTCLFSWSFCFNTASFSSQFAFLHGGYFVTDRFHITTGFQMVICNIYY